MGEMMIDIFNVESTALEQEKTIRVYLPKSYEKSKRYPVVYMHDGQNLFDRETSAYGHIWQAHEVIESLIKNHVLEGLIIVGIDNGPGLERLNEYSPWPADDYKKFGFDEPVGGKGGAYGRFIVEALKPLIDEKYRTLKEREFTAVAGSSMGGVISLYLDVEYPHVFSKVCAMSTAAWFAEASLMNHLKSYDPGHEVKWYLDVGTKEVEDPKFNQLYIKGSKEIYKTLKSIGVEENCLEMVIEEEGVHNEVAWARRLPYALRWLFR
jgi:predicted alpha/beta superfamily hydrolase